MSVLFASDVHLSAHRPDRVAAFVAFLDGPCRGVERVFLLGDIFDAWLGDDDDRPPHPQVESALRALTGDGVDVAFAHGNHDFLVGEAFARRTGCTLIAQPAVISVQGARVAVLHGDELCTRDHEYQQWRAHFTDTGNQRQFLALPFEQRLARAAALRLESAERTALKAEDIMDVTPEAVTALLDTHRTSHVIHGHTHRPGIHALAGGRSRLVLGDWYRDDQVILWDEAGPCLTSAASLPAS